MCWPYFRISLPCKRRLSLCNQLPLKVPWTLSWTRHANWRVVQVLWWFRMRSFLPARQIIRNVEDSKSFSKSAYPFSESLGFLPWSFSWFGTKRRNKWPNKSTSSWNLAPLIHQFRVLTFYQGGSGLLERDVEPKCGESVFNTGRQDILLEIVLIWMVVNIFLVAALDCEIKIICCWFVFISTNCLLFVPILFLRVSPVLWVDFWAKLPRRDFLKSLITLSLEGVFRSCFALGSFLSRFVLFFSRLIRSASKPFTFVQKTLFLVQCRSVWVIGGVAPKRCSL